MTTALTTTKPGGTLSQLASGNPFLDLGNEMEISTGSFLKYSGNTGKYMFKGVEVEHGTRLAFNILGAKKGWVCWKDSKPVDQIMVDILGGGRIPSEESLKDHGPFKQGDGWKQQLSVVVRSLEGGDQMDFNLSNQSGRNALGALIQEFGAKAAMFVDNNGEPKVPIVEIGAQSFQPRDASGTKWAPTLKLVDWKSQAELAALDPYADDDDTGNEADPLEAEQPLKTTAPKAEGVKGSRRV
jgi:hypothetical protein